MQLASNVEGPETKNLRIGTSEGARETLEMLEAKSCTQYVRYGGQDEVLRMRWGCLLPRRGPCQRGHWKAHKAVCSALLG